MCASSKVLPMAVNSINFYIWVGSELCHKLSNNFKNKTVYIFYIALPIRWWESYVLHLCQNRLNIIKCSWLYKKSKNRYSKKHMPAEKLRKFGFSTKIYFYSSLYCSCFCVLLNFLNALINARNSAKCLKKQVQGTLQ